MSCFVSDKMRATMDIQEVPNVCEYSLKRKNIMINVGESGFQQTPTQKVTHTHIHIRQCHNFNSPRTFLKYLSTFLYQEGSLSVSGLFIWPYSFLTFSDYTVCSFLKLRNFSKQTKSMRTENTSHG